jgi:hypothetical protein
MFGANQRSAVASICSAKLAERVMEKTSILETWQNRILFFGFQGNVQRGRII